MNQTHRRDIAYPIFELLAIEKAPCIVIGNLGFGLASCLRFLLQFEEDYGIKLQNQLQIVYSQDQELVCMFKHEEGQYIQQKLFPGSTRYLWIDIYISMKTLQAAAERIHYFFGLHSDLCARIAGFVVTF